jgi:hypothetical protein
MYRNFNAVVGRPFRVALLRVQTVARLKPCPTYKKSRRRPNYTPNGLKFNFYFGKFRLKTFVDVKLLSFGKVKISTV